VTSRALMTLRLTYTWAAPVPAPFTCACALVLCTARDQSSGVRGQVPLYVQAVITLVKGATGSSPNTICDAPPGAASTRLELRSVRKLPTFWPPGRP